MGGVRGESGGVTIPICQQKGVLASDLWFMSECFRDVFGELFFHVTFLRMRLRCDVSGFDQGVASRRGFDQGSTVLYVWEISCISAC